MKCDYVNTLRGCDGDGKAKFEVRITDLSGEVDILFVCTQCCRWVIARAKRYNSIIEVKDLNETD